MNLNIINAQNFQFRQNTFIARQTVTKGLRNILSSINNNYSYSFLTASYRTGISTIFINLLSAISVLISVKLLTQQAQDKRLITFNHYR